MSQSFNIIKHLLITAALFLTCGVLIACGSILPSDTQYTNKMAVDPFVAQLNGKITKMVELNLEPGQKIAWMGLNHSGDYKYFQVESVKLNGKTFAPKTVSPEYVFNSFPPVAAIAGVPAEKATTVYITITYKAKKPHATDNPNKPFKAALLVVMESGRGQQGSLLINLEGYVRGVCSDCKLPLDRTLTYELADNDGDGTHDFGLFLCDSKALIGKVQTNNISDLPDDPIFHLPTDSASTSPWRFDIVNLTGTVLSKDVPVDFTFYESDKRPNSIVIDAGGDGVAPSVPPFEIPVPGGRPVEKVDVKLLSNFQVACPVNAEDGTFNCSDDTDSGIILDVFDGKLNVNPLTLTTGSVVAGSRDCPNFGTWTGSGVVGDLENKEITVIGFATIPDEQPDITKNEKTEIEGATLIAVIKLKLKE